MCSCNTLVSGRNLPVIGVDLFAISFDGLGHQAKIIYVYASRKMQEVFALPSLWLGQSAGKVEYLCLLLNG